MEWPRVVPSECRLVPLHAEALPTLRLRLGAPPACTLLLCTQQASRGEWHVAAQVGDEKPDAWGEGWASWTFLRQGEFATLEGDVPLTLAWPRGAVGRRWPRRRRRPSCGVPAHQVVARTAETPMWTSTNTLRTRILDHPCCPVQPAAPLHAGLCGKSPVPLAPLARPVSASPSSSRLVTHSLSPSLPTCTHRRPPRFLALPLGWWAGNTRSNDAAA